MHLMNYCRTQRIFISTINRQYGNQSSSPASRVLSPDLREVTPSLRVRMSSWVRSSRTSSPSCARAAGTRAGSSRESRPPPG